MLLGHALRFSGCRQLSDGLLESLFKGGDQPLSTDHRCYGDNIPLKAVNDATAVDKKFAKSPMGEVPHDATRVREILEDMNGAEDLLHHRCCTK
jgi:hypothetical protein